MIDLERALEDLAEQLDHPAGVGLTAIVRSRISEPARLTDRRPAHSRSLLAAAAILLVIVMAALAIPPTRHAIADWLGIGAIEVRRSDQPLGDGTSGRTVPGSPDATSSGAITARKRLAEARKVVDFEIATPRAASIGALAGVEIDRRVPGGLVALAYPRFTLVELASYPGDPEPIAKAIDPGTRVDRVRVGESSGLWVTGAHKIVYLDRSGQMETDTVRRSGPALIWERGGVTYRIEGFDVLADAQRVAASIG